MEVVGLEVDAVVLEAEVVGPADVLVEGGRVVMGAVVTGAVVMGAVVTGAVVTGATLMGAVVS